MKKRILGVVLTMSMLFGMTATASADPKAVWKAAPGTATIDGEKDAVYAGAQQLKMAAVSDGDADGTASNAWIVYDDKAFYVFVEVKDSKLDDKSANVYEKDSVEFRIDNKDNLMQAYAVSEKFDNKGEKVSDVKILKTKDGYNVEFKVPCDTKKGDVKFTLQVNAAADGKRNCTLHTNEDLMNAWQSNDVFETLTFGTAAVTDKKDATVEPTAAPTVAPTKAPAKKAPAKKAAKKVTKKKAAKKTTKKK